MSRLIDMHVYTNNSPFCRDKISLMCESAAEKGLRAVAFTDTVELDRFDLLESRRRLRHAYFDMMKARELFRENLSVLAGVELCQPIGHGALVKEILSRQRYDVVLMSVNRFSDGTDLPLSPDMRQNDFDRFAERYADELLQAVQTTDFDVLTKLLAPLRGLRVRLTYFEECIKRVLAALAERDLALELDTKDVLGAENVRDMYLRLVSYYREAGGRHLTVGSECCWFDEIGAGISLAVSAARRAGFEKTTFYEGRFPYEVN